MIKYFFFQDLLFQFLTWDPFSVSINNKKDQNRKGDIVKKFLYSQLYDKEI